MAHRHEAQLNEPCEACRLDDTDDVSWGDAIFGTAVLVWLGLMLLVILSLARPA